MKAKWYILGISLIILTAFFCVIAPFILHANDIPWFKAKVVRVVDGDTVKVEISIRFADMDAPELPTTDGRFAKIQLMKMLAEGDTVWIRPADVDRYGRLVAYVATREYHDIGQAMKEMGLAKHVDWKGRRLWPGGGKEDEPQTR